MFTCSIYVLRYIEDCRTHVITVHVIELVNNRYIYRESQRQFCGAFTEILKPSHLLFLSINKIILRLWFSLNFYVLRLSRIVVLQEYKNRNLHYPLSGILSASVGSSSQTDEPNICVQIPQSLDHYNIHRSCFIEREALHEKYVSVFLETLI